MAGTTAQTSDAQTSDTETICVIIAAKNAADTIQAAVKSALFENLVSEVVVVDDGSTDDTAQAARLADDGTGRLNIISLKVNQGPSAARNQAIAASSAPLIAILDADDFFFPGRFEPMLAESDWDMLADNIAFMADPSMAEAPERFEARSRSISLIEFVEGNISQRGKPRGETGFLKPVIRRSFLEEHGLRYDEKMRLGEDYDLYVRALARGARYKVIEHCGYGAVVRGNSLSARHRTHDLRMLYEADEAILSDPLLPMAARDVITRHRDHIRARYEHRAFLDVKAQNGGGAAISYLLGRLQFAPAVSTAIFYDKLDAFRGNSTPAAAAAPTAMRYLLPGVPVVEDRL
ncbi:glycosyltransferase family 2 protein [Neorhizobium alkalisoli]|uniref:Succinoglycan biosynthesis protein ExoU n=1 Tax=Neorhizobium alkalisoli TaxID=528178 RepID=A0A561QPC8_9HYPH|nr:glycosyltransferase family 2 protein [Neorhizobium alkalisoli]TWF52243.1 succinoglycan biosynthesis protein ExoU [Neorhizobium alkalisoli]